MYTDYLKMHHGEPLGVESAPPKKKAKGRKKADDPSLAPGGWAVDAEVPEAHEASLRRAMALQFLKFRAANELSRDKWRDIVTDDVALVLPREPYRVAFGTNVTPNTTKVVGVEGVVNDTRSIGAVAERSWRLPRPWRRRPH